MRLQFLKQKVNGLVVCCWAPELRLYTQGERLDRGRGLGARCVRESLERGRMGG
jgi:hypothetical protein